MENQTKKRGALVAIITMVFLFAMIAFVTNMAAPLVLSGRNIMKEQV